MRMQGLECHTQQAPKFDIWLCIIKTKPETLSQVPRIEEMAEETGWRGHDVLNQSEMVFGTGTLQRKPCIQLWWKLILDTKAFGQICVVDVY